MAPPVGVLSNFSNQAFFCLYLRDHGGKPPSRSVFGFHQSKSLITSATDTENLGAAA